MQKPKTKKRRNKIHSPATEEEKNSIRFGMFQKSEIVHFALNHKCF